MDYRTKNFQEKFASASPVLGVPPIEIMSVKLRDMINSYSEYDAFFHELAHRHRFTLTPVTGEFQGKGYALKDGPNTIILVQHESGLEILNAAASVATLVGLVPLVIQAWQAFRRHRHHRDRPEPYEIEIRRVDSAGNLIEEHAHSRDQLLLGSGEPASFPFTALLESELRRLNTELVKLTERVNALEARKPRKRPAATRKKKPKRRA
jgi:hypothetical protein